MNVPQCDILGDVHKKKVVLWALRYGGEGVNTTFAQKVPLYIIGFNRFSDIIYKQIINFDNSKWAQGLFKKLYFLWKHSVKAGGWGRNSSQDKIVMFVSTFYRFCLTFHSDCFGLFYIFINNEVLHHNNYLYLNGQS